MSLNAFLQSLFESGRVIVGPYTTLIHPDDVRQADATLVEWDDRNRLDFPGSGPAFQPDVARWGAVQFFRACQAATYRDLDAATLARCWSTCPVGNPIVNAYNVDLVFRFLPGLYVLAKGVSEGDPLCEQLKAWSVQWPLSSVGMKGITGCDVSAICSHPALKQLYVDRIVATQDESRLDHADIRQAVRAALGLHTHLAPRIAQALQTRDEPGG